MNEKQRIEDGTDVVSESPRTESQEQAREIDAGGDGEFKLTIKKLDMPVRPRGVLAE